MWLVKSSARLGIVPICVPSLRAGTPMAPALGWEEGDEIDFLSLFTLLQRPWTQRSYVWGRSWAILDVMPVTLDSVCPLDCPDTCSLSVTVEDDRLTKVNGSHRNPLTAGYICAKVRSYTERVY